MKVCPQYGTWCPNQECHFEGCEGMDGYPMLEVCLKCNGTIDEEIEQCGTCTCEDRDGYTEREIRKVLVDVTFVEMIAEAFFYSDDVYLINAEEVNEAQAILDSIKEVE